MRPRFKKNGYYEIIPIHKASYMESKAELLLSKQWKSKYHSIYTSNILTTHLLLIHYKNAQKSYITQLLTKNKQISQESDEINDNVIVIGHVALRYCSGVERNTNAIQKYSALYQHLILIGNITISVYWSTRVISELR